MRTLRVDAEMAATIMRNRSIRLIPTIFAASLAVLLGAGTVAANAQEPTTKQCLDPATCPIPYVRLAKQESEPFLFQGKMMDEGHPRHKQYRKALRRFPEVRSCLTEEEYEKPQPDLRQIDWVKIGTAQEIDVCVFRIFSSIEDVPQIKKWLTYHGFSLDKAERKARPNYTPKYATEPASYITGYLTPDQFRKIIPKSWIARLLGFEGLRGYSLTIGFSSLGRVVGVFSGGGTIFN